MRNPSILTLSATLLAVLALAGAGCKQNLPVASSGTPQQPPQPAKSTSTLPNEAANTSSAAAPPAAPVAKPPAAAKPTLPKTTTAKPAPANTTSVVTITSSSFEPQILAVKAGDTVVWINKDTVSHTAKSDGTLLWDSGNIAPGAKFSHVFKATGEYPYSCAIHPNVHGTIIVR